MKTALKAGAYAAPVIIAAGMPTPVGAQVSGPTGTLTGLVTNAQNAQPIAGATVSVGGVSAMTDQAGNYTIPNAPAGMRTATTSASGFSTRTDPVNITAGGSTTFNTSLVPTTVGTGIAAVLTWGAQPSDLDSHLVGPDGAGGRFHCYYANRTPVAFVTLDVDDTSAFGPETITVSQVSGSYVAGSYNYYIRNYSGSPGFDVSSAVVTVFASGTQVAQYSVSAATGSPAERIWSVFQFTLTASGAGSSITPVQTLIPDSGAPTIAAGPAKS
ncbi:MAG: carboxypeptidase regulatory-like domain-containing protein [Acidobacteriota bacterium]|nr:carboxypeptidase regulatory-like domain-containing protein [Acidobacteriota bacterium]